MKRLCLIVLLVGLMTSSAFAATKDWVGSAGTGEWSASADYWNPAGIPADTGLTADYVKIQTTTDCTLNSAAGNFGFNKVTVAGMTATLEIIGGSIGIGNELQVSDAGKTGYIVQTGGSVSTFQGNTAGKIEVGYKLGGVGYYTISGGSIGFSGTTNVGQIIIGGAGATGATGTFTVKGNAATINTDKFWVGTKDATGAYPGTGTVAFELGSGVSPITAAYVYIDPTNAAAVVANLTVTGSSLPSGDILLVSNTGSDAIHGIFDSLNGGSAAEGASVVLGGTTYTLTYLYDAATGTHGVGNDIALIPEPATLALLGLGSLIAIRRRRSK